MKTTNAIFRMTILFCLFSINSQARTLYVSLASDATAWSNITTDANRIKQAVTTDFSEAFTAILQYDTVLIAKGEYYCSININIKSAATGTQKPYLKIYGGFSGAETLATNAELIAGRAKSDLDNNGVVEPWEFTNASVLHRRGKDYTNNTIRMISLESTDSSIDGLTILDNQSTIPNGGGVSALSVSSIVRNCIIRNISLAPTAAGISRGGGIYVRQGTVDGCLIEGCSLNGTNAALTSQYGAGIAIDNNNPSGKVINSVIRNNAVYNISATKKALGGGIYMERGSVAENCIVYNNYSQDLGGGVYMAGQGGNLYNVTIANNKAETNGGGIYVALASVNPSNMYNIAVAGNVIADNSANNIQLKATSTTIQLTGYATDGGNDVAINQIGSPVAVILSSTLTDYFSNPTTFKGISASQANLDEIKLAKFNPVNNCALVNAGVSTVATVNSVSYVLDTKDIYKNLRVGNYDIGAIEGSFTTASNEFNSNESNVFTSRNALFVKGIKAPSVLKVYSVNGVLIHSSTISTDGFATLIPKGVFLVKINSSNYKIIN